MKSVRAAYFVIIPVPELAQPVQAVASSPDAHVMMAPRAEESRRFGGPSVGLAEGQVSVYHDHSCVSGFVVHVMRMDH